MAIVAGGGQAEFAVVHERTAMPVPDELDWTAAGGVPEVFTTAHDALFTQAGLTVGERLLVHGAAGGVGMAAVQLGVMAGARVTATVRDEHAREQVAALGAHAIAPEGFAEEGEYDVILELVGAPEPVREPRLARDRRADLHHRRRRGGEDRDRPAQADGQARADPRLDAAQPADRGEGDRRAAGGEDGAAGVRVRRPLRAGDARRSRSRRRPAAYERFQAGGKFGKIVLET